jgi:hypothetical protein
MNRFRSSRVDDDLEHKALQRTLANYSVIWSLLRLENKLQEATIQVTELRKQFGALSFDFNHSYLDRGTLELHNEHFAEQYNDLTDLTGSSNVPQLALEGCFQNTRAEKHGQVEQAYSEASLLH